MSFTDPMLNKEATDKKAHSLLISLYESEE